MISEKFLNFSVIVGSFLLFTNVVEAQECGNVKYVSGLIYGGTYAQRGQWPWLCAIHDTTSDEFFCGSTLISKKHVLTGEFNILES
jgi:secreted trypsin-like serine protease